MTSIVATSDLHQHFNFILPRADLAVIAGDWSYRATKKEIILYTDWLLRQKQAHPDMEIVWINGNHELSCEAHIGTSLYIANKTGTHYLEDSGIELCGLKIWGSPYQPEFNGWAYQYPRGTERWRQIPEGLDILVVHGPPARTELSFTKRYYEPTKGEDVGCEDLRLAIEQKQPRVFICGHIHDAYGYDKIGQTECYNVARCDENYDDTNDPVMIEL